MKSGWSNVPKWWQLLPPGAIFPGDFTCWDVSHWTVNIVQDSCGVLVTKKETIVPQSSCFSPLKSLLVVLLSLYCFEVTATCWKKHPDCSLQLPWLSWGFCLFRGSFFDLKSLTEGWGLQPVFFRSKNGPEMTTNLEMQNSFLFNELVAELAELENWWKLAIKSIESMNHLPTAWASISGSSWENPSIDGPRKWCHFKTFKLLITLPWHWWWLKSAWTQTSNALATGEIWRPTLQNDTVGQNSWHDPIATP